MYLGKTKKATRVKYSGLLRSYPELQLTKPLFPVSFAVALLGTCRNTSQELNPVRVLHRISLLAKFITDLG